METNLIQIISACIVLASSLVPLYFMLGVKSERQRLLSTILFIVLQTYVVHSLIEAFQVLEAGYQLLTKLCFVISTFGLMVSYAFFQVKTKHTLIGGLFGAVMVSAFVIWMIGEIAETIFIHVRENIERATSLTMTGFACFIVFRFFWLRNVVLLEAKA